MVKDIEDCSTAGQQLSTHNTTNSGFYLGTICKNQPIKKKPAKKKLAKKKEKDIIETISDDVNNFFEQF